MRFFIILTILAVAICSTTAFIWDGLFEQSSGCTVLVDVPIDPYHSYFKSEWFPSLNAKLAANQNRYDRNLHQVWVDAPDPSFCPPYNPHGFNGRCCLNGFFDAQYQWLVFRSGEKKKVANEELWRQAQAQHRPVYRVYADAPERYCKRSYGGLADFLG